MSIYHLGPERPKRLVPASDAGFERSIDDLMMPIGAASSVLRNPDALPEFKGFPMDPPEYDLRLSQDPAKDAVPPISSLPSWLIDLY